MSRAPASVRVLLVSSLAASVGCVSSLSSQITRTGPGMPARATDSPVAVFFRNVAPPDWLYAEVGRIRVESARSSVEDVLAEAEARARELGADGIIVDLRWHYQSLPVTFDAAGAPHVPDTPRLNANVIAISYAPEPHPAEAGGP